MFESERRPCENYWDCVYRCLKERGLGFDIGNIAGTVSLYGLVPRGIGYQPGSFWHGGRTFYHWANQYGTRIKATTWTQAGGIGSTCSLVGAGLTGWTIGSIGWCYSQCR